MKYEYKDKLVEKADELAFVVYKLSISAPKHELYGFISQLQRAALSVVLNMIEGYARLNRKEYRRFLLISFGSLKETMYLLEFGVKIGYFKNTDVEKINDGYDEVAKMLWAKIQTLKSN